MIMKKLSFITLFMAFLSQGLGQIVPQYFTHPSSVDLFGLYEIAFSIPYTYINPYDPDTILIYGVFTGPDNSSDTVHAFYYEDYTFQKHNGYELATHNSPYDGWRIRFTPTKTGTWSFKIRAFDANGQLSMPFMNVSYSFSCNSISNGKGFISKANSRFLKRDVVDNGQRKNHSFFPVGPNIAWYSCKYDAQGNPIFKYSKGIYSYEMYIDSLDGNANYMRVFLNRFQFLSLYGPEYDLDTTQTIVYFDSTINQKDSAELDYIITYALQHGVNIIPCLLNCGAFNDPDNDHPYDSTNWQHNPFNNIMSASCDIFTNPSAIRISKNLIRYIISRWGYATNIVCWELWNEVGNMFDYEECGHNLDQDAKDWHDEMAAYITSIDPFNHFITTSTGDIDVNPIIYSIAFDNLDLVQQHKYANIQKAKSREQLSYLLYQRAINAQTTDYPLLPFFMGEFGFGGQTVHSYHKKDPHGIDLHNSLWSSFFSASIGPASFWFWNYLKADSLFCRYKPVYTFSQNLPILSDSFTAHQTGHEVGNSLVFPNNLETYYMINSTEDTIYGWSQDTAFAYQSLRRLTDYVNNGHFTDVFDTLGYVYKLDVTKRPQPSSSSNIIRIPITNQPLGTNYSVKWYNSETGFAYNTGAVISTIVQMDTAGSKFIHIYFPSFFRDLKNWTINNTFGDAVFVLTKKTEPDTETKR